MFSIRKEGWMHGFAFHKFVFLGQISNSGCEVVVSCDMQISCLKAF